MDLATATYFTDVAFQISDAISATFSMHAAVLIAAVGWAISSRAQPRGHGPLAIALVAVTLSLFFTINVISLNTMFGLFNAAMEIPRDYWSDKPVPPAAKAIFAPFGAAPSGGSAAWFMDWRPYAIAVDALAVVGVSLLLSGVGRPQRPG